MLTTQKMYFDYLEKVEKELQNATISLDNGIAELKTALRTTELTIPVIGAFSSGKSSLINSLLGKSLLPVGIPPETALATELRYSHTDFLEAVKADDTVVKYSATEINALKENANDYKFARLFLNNDKLKNISPLVLVDMPGFDSPLDFHNKAIINYLNRGVYYIALISVEDGNITRSIVRQLSDIRESGREFALFLSKSNLKAESEVNEIAAKIKEQVQDEFNIDKKVIPIGNNGGESLEKVIKTINPDALFASLFIENLKQNHYDIIGRINIAISSLKKDSAENKRALQELQDSLNKLLQKQTQMIDEAKQKYSDVNIRKVVDSVGKELRASLNELVSVGISGGSDALSRQITEIVRHSLLANIKSVMGDISNNIVDDFAVELKNINSMMSSFTMDGNWLENLAQSTKDVINRGNDILNGIIESRNKKTDTSKIYKIITTILAITTSILNPILEIVIVFLPDIISKLMESSMRQKQEEQVRRYVMAEVIPGIQTGLSRELPSRFNEQVNNLIKEICEKFETNLQEIRSEITKAQAEKESKIFNTEEHINKYCLAKDNITTLANKIIFN